MNNSQYPDTFGGNDLTETGSLTGSVASNSSRNRLATNSMHICVLLCLKRTCVAKINPRLGARGDTSGS